MVIAVNIRSLSGDTAAVDFLVSYFKKIAAENQDHQFYFISERDSVDLSSLPNVTYSIIKQQTNNPLLWKLWYNYSLPSLLRKIKANVLVSADGVACLRTKLPQLLLVNDLEFFHHPEWFSRRYVSFMRSALPASLKKVKRVITFSEAVKTELGNTFPSATGTSFISSLKHTKSFKSLSWEEKKTVKEKYTNGNEYFLFHGAIHARSNLLNLLKAFSLFKKRQKSSLWLVLLTDKIPVKNEFVDSLRLYKYRNEVKLIETTNEEESFLLTATAFCKISLSTVYGDVLTLQQASFFEVPVIAAENAQAKEILSTAALYVNPGSINSIADQLMMIYKDEEMQNNLIGNSRQLRIEEPVDDLWLQINAVINAAGNL